MVCSDHCRAIGDVGLGMTELLGKINVARVNRPVWMQDGSQGWCTSAQGDWDASLQPAADSDSQETAWVRHITGGRDPTSGSSDGVSFK